MNTSTDYHSCLPLSSAFLATLRKKEQDLRKQNLVYVSSTDFVANKGVIDISLSRTTYSGLAKITGRCWPIGEEGTIIRRLVRQHLCKVGNDMSQIFLLKDASQGTSIRASRRSDRRKPLIA